MEEEVISFSFLPFWLKVNANVVIAQGRYRGYLGTISKIHSPTPLTNNEYSVIVYITSVGEYAFPIKGLERKYE